MLSQTALTFLHRSHLPNEVRGPVSEGWNGVGILHPSADGETGELYLCVTFVSHTYDCPMRVSPRFSKSGFDERIVNKAYCLCELSRASQHFASQQVFGG